MTREHLLGLYGEFTWDFGQKFFIQTSEGNFVWSDPDYGGDNTIRPYNGTLQHFFGEGFGRGKGVHTIASYCGEGVVFTPYEIPSPTEMWDTWEGNGFDDDGEAFAAGVKAERERVEKAPKKPDGFQGHNKPCYYCDKPCNDLVGDPGMWSIPLCHGDEPGVVKYHHTGCLMARLKE